jgi:hypothetical protein
VALRKRIGAQQHHRASFSNGEWLAYSTGVGAHEIELEFSNLFARNADVGELAHPRGDRIRHAIFRDQRIHHRAGAIDRYAGVGIKKNGTALDGDVTDCLESKVFAADV